MEAKADRILSRTWYIYSRIFQHISQKLSQSDQKLVKTIECLITINKLIEIDFCVCVHCTWHIVDIKYFLDGWMNEWLNEYMEPCSQQIKNIHF